MDTLELVDRRIRNRLGRINRMRSQTEQGEVRLDLDTPLRGYLQLREEFIYHFREELRFEPLLTVKVTYRDNVFYFDVSPGMAYDSELYRALKVPPNRSRPTDTFWLSTELDAPLDAIEKHMDKALLQ